jgi:hypothetical protein
MCKRCSVFLFIAGIVSLFVIGANNGSLAQGAALSEAEVQGFYVGTGSDAVGEFKIEARIVAEGDGNFTVFVRQMRGQGQITRAELKGKTEVDTVTLTGKVGAVKWKGTYDSGSIKGTCLPGGTFEIHRIDKKSPTLGKKPPPGAIVLLDGKDFSEMVLSRGARWDLDKLRVGEDGSIQVPRGGMTSKRSFEGSYDLHVEFLIPLMPKAHSQGRGNSGVFLTNSDEIQILDSFGDATYLGGGCGGIYAYKDPDTMETIESLKGNPQNKFSLASLPPLAWQTFDIQYRIQMKDGKAVGKPRVTVWHNGIKIHDNVEIRGAVIPYSPKGKFHFQDHGNPVRFRNIWVLPVDFTAARTTSG